MPGASKRRRLSCCCWFVRTTAARLLAYQTDDTKLSAGVLPTPPLRHPGNPGHDARWVDESHTQLRGKQASQAGTNHPSVRPIDQRTGQAANRPPLTSHTYNLRYGYCGYHHKQKRDAFRSVRANNVRSNKSQQPGATIIAAATAGAALERKLFLFPEESFRTVRIVVI